MNSKMQESKLISKGRLPTHIAIVPDGNRRWARQKGLKPWKGHYAGIKVVEKLLDWLWEYDIPIISFYALSTDNLKKRSKNEVNHLVGILKKQLTKLVSDKKIHNNQVKVNVLGDLDSLPVDIKNAAEHVMEKTKNYKKRTLNLLMPYSGKFEIINAIKNIINDVNKGRLKQEDFSENVFEKYLFTNGLPNPDLVIRTAEKRMSDFLIWQTAYSEIFFIENKYWPDFTSDDLKKILIEFSERERRFGK